MDEPHLSDVPSDRIGGLYTMLTASDWCFASVLPTQWACSVTWGARPQEGGQ